MRRAPRNTRRACLCQPQAPSDPAQQRARRGSQCTLANRSLTHLRPTPSDAAPTPEQPRRAAGTPRHAAHLLGDALTTRNRRGERLRVGQFRPQGSTVLHRPEMTPRASKPAAPSPADLITSAQAPRSSARAARASAHTPTARRSGVPAPSHAVHSRAEPEKPRRSAGAPQTRAAPSKSRPGRVGSARARGTQVPEP